MKKRKTLSTRFSIAQKVIADLTNVTKQKVINIRDLKKAKVRDEELEATIASEKELSLLDPFHAVYVYGQNRMGVFVEQLAEIPAVAKLVAAYVICHSLNKLT